MKRFKVHLKRTASVPYVAEVVVEVADDEPATELPRLVRHGALCAVMEGRVDFEPILADAEFSGESVVEQVESLPTTNKRYFRTHVALLVEGEDEAHAEEAVSELLRNHSMSMSGGDSGLVTWEFANNPKMGYPRTDEVQHTSGAPDEYDTDIEALPTIEQD